MVGSQSEVHSVSGIGVCDASYLECQVPNLVGKVRSRSSQIETTIQFKTIDSIVTNQGTSITERAPQRALDRVGFRAV